MVVVGGKAPADNKAAKTSKSKTETKKTVKKTNTKADKA